MRFRLSIVSSVRRIISDSLLMAISRMMPSSPKDATKTYSRKKTEIKNTLKTKQKIKPLNKTKIK